MNWFWFGHIVISISSNCQFQRPINIQFPIWNRVQRGFFELNTLVSGLTARLTDKLGPTSYDRRALLRYSYLLKPGKIAVRLIFLSGLDGVLRFRPHSTQICFISSNEIDFKIENARNMVLFRSFSIKILKNNVNRENWTFTGILKSIFAIGIVASASLLIHFHSLRTRASWIMALNHCTDAKVLDPASPDQT